MLFFMSCNSKKHNQDDVKEITIIELLTNKKKSFNDSENIQKITDEINNSKREPLKFVAEYRLELKFKDSMKVVLIRNSSMNIKGITYRLNNDLGLILGKMVNN